MKQNAPGHLPQRGWPRACRVEPPPGSTWAYRRPLRHRGRPSGDPRPVADRHLQPGEQLSDLPGGIGVRRGVAVSRPQSGGLQYRPRRALPHRLVDLRQRVHPVRRPEPCQRGIRGHSRPVRRQQGRARRRNRPKRPSGLSTALGDRRGARHRGRPSRCGRLGGRCLQHHEGQASRQAGSCHQQRQDPLVAPVIVAWPARRPDAHWMHGHDDAAPVSPDCPAHVTTVSQRTACDTPVTIPGPVHDTGGV